MRGKDETKKDKPLKDHCCQHTDQCAGIWKVNETTQRLSTDSAITPIKDSTEHNVGRQQTRKHGKNNKKGAQENHNVERKNKQETQKTRN